jgi:hypothetical protein
MSGNSKGYSSMKLLTNYLLILVGMWFAGCAAAPGAEPIPTPEYTRVSEATLPRGAVVPPPQGDVVLRVTGAIGNSNVEGDTAVEFDVETLEALGVVEFSTYDLVAYNETSVYGGVLLDDVLKAVQPDASATMLRMSAIDGYAADVPISDAQTYAVIVATQRDNTYLTLETFGPLRMIYPPSAPVEIDERWIWSVELIVVR